MAYNTVARRLPHADYVVKFSYHIKEKRGSRSSLATYQGRRKTHWSNKQRRSRADDVYISNNSIHLPVQGDGVQSGYIYIPRRHLPLSRFRLQFQNFLRSDRSKTRRCKRLSSICHRPPTNPVGADDVTKVHNYLQLTNDEVEKLLRNDD